MYTFFTSGNYLGPALVQKEIFKKYGTCTHIPLLQPFKPHHGLLVGFWQGVTFLFLHDKKLSTSEPFLIHCWAWKIHIGYAPHGKWNGTVAFWTQLMTSLNITTSGHGIHQTAVWQKLPKGHSVIKTAPEENPLIYTPLMEKSTELQPNIRLSFL